MKNNEKFIENWKNNRRNGKIKYIVKYYLGYSIMYWLFFVIYVLVKENNLHQLTKSEHLPAFLGCFIGFSIGGIIMQNINWAKNEEKYRNLLSDK